MKILGLDTVREAAVSLLMSNLLIFIFMEKIYEMSLMERIDFIRTNSVTDEEFERFWGKSIDECVSELMVHASRLEADVRKCFE